MKRRAFFNDLENQPPLKRTTIIRPPLTPAQSQAVRREVKKEIARKTDWKVTHTQVSSATIDWSGTVKNLLDNMSRGTGPQDEFIASTIRIKYVRIRGQVGIADQHNSVRVMTFQWNDSGTPVVTGLINNSGTALAPWGTIYWTNKPNIKVLRDEVLAGDLNNETFANFDYFIPGKKIKTVFWATASAAVQQGGLFTMVISDSSVANHPTIKYTVEIVYSDA